MAHIDKNHPARYLIESAANGRKLTAGDLEMLTGPDALLPPGQSLSKYAQDITAAASRVAAIGAQGHRNEALNAARNEWDNISERFTPEQAAVTGKLSDAQNQEIDNMIQNAFDR